MAMAVREIKESGIPQAAAPNEEKSAIHAITALFLQLPEKEQGKALKAIVKHHTGSAKATEAGASRDALSYFFQLLNGYPEEKKKAALVEANERLARHGLATIPLQPKEEKNPTLEKIDAILNGVSKPKAALSFSEKSFIDMAAAIKALVEESKAHRQDEETLVTRVIEKEYDNKMVVADYGKWFNPAVDLLAKMSLQESEIKKLRESIAAIIQEYTKRNCDSLSYLQTQCANLAKQHAQLEKKVTNGWMASGVKTAAPGSLDRYQPKAKEAAPDAEPTESSFTPFFDRMTAYATHFTVLLKDFEKHLGKVKALKDLIPGAPNRAELEEEVPKLVAKYKDMHDRCLDAFEFLAQQNASLANLQAAFNKVFAQMTTEVNEDRSLLLKAADALAIECRKVNPLKPGWRGIDPIRTLALTATEKDKYTA